MDFVYDPINEVLAGLGIEYRMDSLVDLGVGVLAVVMLALMVMHLLFDD